MSYQEKTTIVNIITTLLVSALFWVYTLQRYQAENPELMEVFKFWGTAFIALVAISIVANIIIIIIFTIINAIVTQEEEDPSFTDERDKLIELKGTRNASYLFSAGVVFAMFTVALDAHPTMMFIILLLSGMAGDLFGNLTRLYFYRRGF